MMYGALRETHEELGIDPKRVEILGEIGPPEFSLGAAMKVWPFVVSTVAKFCLQQPTFNCR